MIEFSESTSMYFYSALLQADAAMISIVGFFVIFWVQSLEHRIALVMNSLKAAKVDFEFEINNFFSNDVINQEAYIESNPSKTGALPFYRKAVTLKKKILKIKTSIKLPTILLTLGIVLSAVLLLCSNSLHLFHPRYELFFATLTLIYHFLILFFVVRIILLAVNENQ